MVGESFGGPSPSTQVRGVRIVLAKALAATFIGPFRWIGGIFDRRDERRARKLRLEFGRRLRILSWQRVRSGTWQARLSGPGLDHTLERIGSTRVRAARAASEAMDHLFVMRYTLRPRGHTDCDEAFDDEARPGRTTP